MAFQQIGIPAASVMDRLAAQIAAEFGPQAGIRIFKRRVRGHIKLGAGHPANMARYGKRLALIRDRLVEWQRANAFARQIFDFTPPGHPDIALQIAIRIVDNMYREEQKTFAVAAALGYGNRLSLMVLRELRLMLRVLRRSEFRGHFSGLLAFTIGHALEAAE